MSTEIQIQSSTNKRFVDCLPNDYQMSPYGLELLQSTRLHYTGQHHKTEIRPNLNYQNTMTELINNSKQYEHRKAETLSRTNHIGNPLL